MKTVGFIIFFAIFLTVLGLISLYIFIRGLQSLPPNSSLRHAYTAAFWIIALSYFAGRLMERIWPSALSDLLIWMGSFWLAAVLYFLIAVVALDTLRLANHYVPFFPGIVADHYSQAKYFCSAGILGLVGLLLIAGHINAMMPRINRLNLAIAKKSPHMKSLNIAVVSDIHLGTIIGKSHFDSIVNTLNGLDPDLVLLPGDIVDEDLAPVIKQNLGESLMNIQSRFGVYAVTGNHEYIGGAEKACAYLAEHHIVMLRDQSIKINDSFFLVGREDRSMNWATGRKRKDLAALMAGVDKSYPVILMDHQPFNLEEAAQQGIDLQLSGHTHNAQLWPLNYIVQSIYELSWGYKRIGNTHYYVSDGVGTWGPPVRIGNHPEIVNIKLSL
jgi:uncharacterized protein